MSLETAAAESHIQEPLIRALRDPAAYPHPVRRVELIETHISWVLLAGDFAYKIKKPVDLGFLNFSTLDKRRHFCFEELRLNRRLAPGLYLDVVPIVGSMQAPRLEGTGEPIEYAVKMRQFPQSSQLDRMLEAGKVDAATMDDLAAEISRFHDIIPISHASDNYGTPERVMEPARENFEQILSLVDDARTTGRVNALWDRFEDRYRMLSTELAWRKRHGCIRECHGDLHLSNLVELDETVTAFDCIEFSPALRWIDVIDDVAFLMMDLLVRRRSDLAFRFMNVYLEHTGDYRGLRLLRFYMVHRSLVRAKVAALQMFDDGHDASEIARAKTKFDAHIALAERLCQPGSPALIITHGLSGSGKTWVTRRLAPTVPAFWIRSDIERKRLYGLQPRESSESGVAEGLYTSEVNRLTYERLAELTRIVLSSGFTVIVDAAFLLRDQRLAFRQLAGALNVPFVILSCEAPESRLRERIAHRLSDAVDASEADTAVLDYQLRSAQALDPAEQKAVFRVDSGGQFSEDGLAAIRRRLLEFIGTTNSGARCEHFTKSAIRGV